MQLRKAKDEETVKEVIANEVRKKMVGQSEKEIRYAILTIFKAAYYGEDAYTAQDIIDYGKDVSGREKLLEDIENELFLPSRVAKIPVKLYTNRQKPIDPMIM